jgi:hypothetical protein
MGPVGISTGAGTVQSSSTPLVQAAPPSPVPAEYRANLAKVNAKRFVTQGHAGGRFDADVYVTPSAKDAAFGTGPIEPGTLLVMDQVPHGKGGDGPTLMMEKRAAGFDPAHGDWRYVVVDGVRVEDGPLSLCARCHDEAPHDHVFWLGD